jgi:ribonucleoside-triphosphate reductase
MKDLVVIKRDGRKEDFNREKLRTSILKACEKRPISFRVIERTVNSIEREIRDLGKPEITSELIGEMVMKKLKELDEVAYVRFASYYKEFADVKSFEKELRKLRVFRGRSKITKIKKRDGRIVKFDQNKITEAIWKAAQAVGGKDKELAKMLSDEVVAILEEKFAHKIPTVEDVQDVVEKVLVENGHAKTAKAYILYREQRKKARDMRELLLSVGDVVEGYTNRGDWRVQENANMVYSFSGLTWHVAGSVMAHYALNFVYPKEISKAHVDGDFHLHNLSASIVGYCAGWSLRQLLHEGYNGVPTTVESGPPKHLRTALGQMVNFIGTLQHEWAGAQAFSSFDTYLAPFVRSDKLNYKQVKQMVQEFVFNLNVGSRWGSQCVSEDTEVLTENGWRKYDEIKDEKIATFNLQNGRIELLKPERIASYDFDGYLVRLKNRTQEQLVTPNHRVVRKKFNSEKFEFIEAQKLFEFKTPILVPLAGKTESKKEIDENLVKLFAWLVSEGCFSDGKRQRVMIYQSEKNKENCDEIREILRNLNLKWDETKKLSGFSKKRSVIRFRLNQDSSRKIRKLINSKKIPRIIKKLSERQIKLFIDTYVKGDGFIEKNGRIRIVTKDKDIRDSIQELCSLCGYGSTNNLRENNVWQITIIRNPVASITKLDRVRYKGKVWCPTTKNGTFIARRNGKVFITGNTPFTNLTLDWRIPEDLKDQHVTLGGKLQDSVYGDYQEEADMINRAFVEVMIEGDRNGRVFTFPIPTYNITKDFNWDSENSKLLFEMTGKYGLPYFQNFVNSDLRPGDVRAMCCRLQLNMKELKKKTGGLFGFGESTGSIGVVTINMPKIGYLSKDDSQFFERLERMMILAKNSLEIKRKIINRNMEKGLLPYTKRYLGHLNHHFSTIGLVGMNEACLNFFGENIATKQGKEFTIKVLKFMRNKLVEFQEETGHIYNLEATPAEGTSYRLARIDKKNYPNIITSGKDVPYYTNSTNLPVDYTDDIFEALRHQDDIQVLYTGGTVFHGFVGERIDDGESVALLIKRIAENFRLPYFTITPTFSVCPVHGYISGEHFYCPFSHTKEQLKKYGVRVGG